MTNYREKDEISKYVVSELETLGYRKIIDDIVKSIRMGAQFPIRKGLDANHVKHVIYSLAYEDGEKKYFDENIELCRNISGMNVFRKSALALNIQIHYLSFVIELIEYDRNFTSESIKSAERMENILRSHPEVLRVIDNILSRNAKIDTPSLLVVMMQAIEAMRKMVEKGEVLNHGSRHTGRPKAAKSMLVIDVWETLSGYGASKRAVAKMVSEFLLRTDIVPSTPRLSDSLYQTIRNHEVNR